ncbi:MAG: transposase [Lachnospiraceae bacterium]|nr:transposase [Lachnospiraceae bacterium]
MRAVRKPAEEQYRLVLECRRSGMTASNWCREKGINPQTFYTWRQFDWLMSGIEIEQPKALKTAV